MKYTENEQPALNEVVSGDPPRLVSSRLGVSLILFSGVLWLSLFGIPFLPFAAGNRAWLFGAVFIAVQITWWAGAMLAGPATVAMLTRWFRRSRNGGSGTL